MATLLKPHRLANPRSGGRVKNKRMTLKQKLFFGTARQRAAARQSLKGRKRTTNSRSRVTNRKHRRKNVGEILIASNPGRKNTRHRRRRNIQMGYYNATGFHPIRASRDYDSERLFEDTEGSYRSRSKSRTKRKSKSKRRKNPGMTKAARRAKARAYYRRTKATHRSRSSGHRHRRRNPNITSYNTARQPNRRHRRRRNSPKVVVRYRNRSRMTNRRHRRRNPIHGFGVGTIADQFKRVGGLIAGAYITRVAAGFIPAQFTTGFVGYIATALVAYLQGKILGKLMKSPAFGAAMTEGGFVYLALKIAQDMGFGANLPFGLSGGRGMGLIAPSSFYVPQVPQRGSMGSFLVPPGVPSPMIVNSPLRGLNNNAIGGGRMGQRRVGRIS